MACHVVIEKEEKYYVATDTVRRDERNIEKQNGGFGNESIY